jgi:hypothetical protein
MRQLLYASVALLALATAAKADVITAVATVDGGLTQTTTTVNGTLNIIGGSIGAFSFNTVSANSQTTLPAPGILTTNSLNLQQTAAGSHTLVLDITASQLVGTNALTNFLSTFSVSGLTAGWTAREQTFINGVQLADTGNFTTPSASALNNTIRLETNPFSAEVRYTITSNGIGGFNGGIDISGTAAVPGPVVGAGFPGLVALLGGIWGWKKRRQSLTA